MSSDVAFAGYMAIGLVANLCVVLHWQASGQISKHWSNIFLVLCLPLAFLWPVVLAELLADIFGKGDGKHRADGAR